MQLNYSIYFNYTGYSISSQEYVLSSLRHNPDLDLRLSYVNHGPILGVSKNRQQYFEYFRKKELAYPHINLFHSIPLQYRQPKNAYKNVGFCIYETIDPPKEWVKIMNSMDAIITASDFNKNVFITSGVEKPIYVVPHCFDEKMFNSNIKPLGRYNLTTFISIGTWKNRKNWEQLIKAWYDAFERKDNVCLLIKTDKPKELSLSVLRIKRNDTWRSKDTAPIYAEESANCNFEQIPQIMKKGDIYISTSLGEGFGIPALHAMALGMPVIIPRFSGHLQYCLPDNCTYIEPSEYRRHPVMDGIPQFNNKIWPVYTISEIRNKLRYVMEKQNVCSEKAKIAYNYVHNNFTYRKIGKLFLESLEL